MEKRHIDKGFFQCNKILSDLLTDYMFYLKFFLNDYNCSGTCLSKEQYFPKNLFIIVKLIVALLLMSHCWQVKTAVRVKNYWSLINHQTKSNHVKSPYIFWKLPMIFTLHQCCQKTWSLNNISNYLQAQ